MWAFEGDAIVRTLDEGCAPVWALDEGNAIVRALDEGCAPMWALDEGYAPVRALDEGDALATALDEGCVPVWAFDEGDALVRYLDEGCALVWALDEWVLPRVFPECVLPKMFGDCLPVEALDAGMFVLKICLSKTSSKIRRGGGSVGTDSFQPSDFCIHSVNSMFTVGCGSILVGHSDSCGMG